MHLDHDKFFDLLVENTGMTPEKAEKQLAELLAEMKAAFDEDGAYEIEGFGIFSKLGNAVHFIPSEELETEINYKYAGMEPIEMPGSEKTDSDEEFEENPIKGMMGEAEEDVYEDPFEDDLIEKKEDEVESFEDAELSTKESSSTEDEALEVPEELDDVLSEFIGVEDEIDSETPEGEAPLEEIVAQEDDDDKESPEIEDPFAEVINEGEEETSSEAESQSEKEKSEPDKTKETKPGPEQWGINAHKQDGQESAFTGLVGDSKNDSDDDDDEAILPEEDPFGEAEAEEDFIPIVTNVSSVGRGKSKETSSKEEPKSKPEVASKVLKDRHQSSPAILYVILIILVIGIAGYVSVHFGLINIDKLADSNNQTAQTSIPTQSEQNTISSTPTNVANEGSDRVEENAQKSEIEQPTQEQVARTLTTTSLNQGATTEPNFGLKGTINEAANTGYTIVLYHLSRESGVDRARKDLVNKGLRTIVKEIPSSKYGVLYRVSVGQFRTMTDAAQAVEDNKGLFRENYSITKIN